VYKKLKEDIPTLIHVPCICHSLQSAEDSETLPRNIEYMIHETYDWFSHSSLRQAQYINLFKAINEGHKPLKIVKACDTRWLSIETTVSSILNQWLEFKEPVRYAGYILRNFVISLLAFIHVLYVF